MADQKFKKGDVVKLKSGSELMNVLGYYIDYAGSVANAMFNTSDFKSDTVTSKVECEWMFKGEKKTGNFEESSLELVRS